MANTSERPLEISERNKMHKSSRGDCHFYYLFLKKNFSDNHKLESVVK